MCLFGSHAHFKRNSYHRVIHEKYVHSKHSFQSTWLYYRCWRLWWQQHQQRQTLYETIWFYSYYVVSFFLALFLYLSLPSSIQYWIIYEIHCNYELEIRCKAVVDCMSFVSLVSWLVIWFFLPSMYWSSSLVSLCCVFLFDFFCTIILSLLCVCIMVWHSSEIEPLPCGANIYILYNLYGFFFLCRCFAVIVAAVDVFDEKKSQEKTHT